MGIHKTVNNNQEDLKNWICFKFYPFNQGCAVGAEVVRSRRLLGGVRVGFLATLGVGVWFFCPTLTPVAQLDHFLHHTPKLGILVAMVQFLLKLLLNQRFLVVCRDFHWFYQPNFIPFMLRRWSRKFLSGRSRESKSEILETRSRKFWKVEVGSPSRIFYLRLRNPAFHYKNNSIQKHSTWDLFCKALRLDESRLLASCIDTSCLKNAVFF